MFPDPSNAFSVYLRRALGHFGDLFFVANDDILLVLTQCRQRVIHAKKEVSACAIMWALHLSIMEIILT